LNNCQKNILVYLSSVQSIPPLIVEGFVKKYYEKEFKHFLRMAMCSSDKTITHFREIWLLTKNIKIDSLL